LVIDEISMVSNRTLSPFIWQDTLL
jgi:hypothetical protein